jgi:hypothetical protein
MAPAVSRRARSIVDAGECAFYSGNAGGRKAIVGELVSFEEDWPDTIAQASDLIGVVLKQGM